VEQLSNSVQALQLQEGGLDSRRSWYASFIEREINNYLLECYIMRDITIVSDRGLERYGVDPEIFNLIYPNWQIVKVGEDGVYVGF
jgi:hypothetical protein